jgi:hypothetical protein
MGMRCGAICHMRAISAAGSLRIPHSALSLRSRFKVSAGRVRAGLMVRMNSSRCASPHLSFTLHNFPGITRAASRATCAGLWLSGRLAGSMFQR